MGKALRRLPPVCFFVAVFLWIFWRIRFPKTFYGKTIQMDDGKRFVVFRHAHRKSKPQDSAAESYKRSFVLGVMNRRAAKDTVTVTTIPNTTVHDYLSRRLVC